MCFRIRLKLIGSTRRSKHVWRRSNERTLCMLLFIVIWIQKCSVYVLIQYHHHINHETTWRRSKTTMKMLGIHHRKLDQTVILQMITKKHQKNNKKKKKHQRLKRVQKQCQLRKKKFRKQRNRRKKTKNRKQNKSNLPKKNFRSRHKMAQVNRMRLKTLWKRRVLVMVIQAFECGDCEISTINNSCNFSHHIGSSAPTSNVCFPNSLTLILIYHQCCSISHVKH